MAENSNCLLPLTSGATVVLYKRCFCCFKSKTACLNLLGCFAVLLIYCTLDVSNAFKNWDSYRAPIVFAVGLSIVAVFAPMAGITAVITLVFLIGSVRFGMDQLQDRPTEDSLLFINWYVWLFYLANFMANIPWSLVTYGSHHAHPKIAFSGILARFMLVTAFLSLLTIFLFVVKLKARFFLIEPPGVNPYKLVFRVTKFAYRHKVPLRRSAFTYCEDELPSRMDLGKLKYGGPFTTKEVEDVKAFWGLLKIVSVIGPAYLLQLVAQAVLNLFSVHRSVHKINSFPYNVTHVEGIAQYILLSNGLLSSLLVVICIPLYLCLIRPHIYYQIPGMLKRIGLGIILILLSLVLSLAMDVAVHSLYPKTPCMLSGFTRNAKLTPITQVDNTTTSPLYQNVYFFVSQHFLSAVANMLIDIAVLEFILSQSPYSMKGLFLGYFFSMKGLFQAIAITFIFPFGRAWKIQSLSCGSGFYIVIIVIGALELGLFSFVAKRYKFRTVNEPSNEYRYAEDYYSNIQ